jgi:DnaJ-class molecular chaperone
LALIAEIEAAMQMGISVELLRYFTETCPKYGENRLLTKKVIDNVAYFDSNELLSYQRYLSQPWPKKPGMKRPHIPEAIKNDVRAECHLACAICGDLNKGEIAHIEAVSATANNSPDNLVLLCPNHHTEYDLGYKPNSNVSLEALRAAKLLKRQARVRIQRYEANAFKTAASVMTTVKNLAAKLKTLESQQMIEVYETELAALMRSLPNMLDASQVEAKKDKSLEDVGALVSKVAPTISRATTGLSSSATAMQIRNAAATVSAAVEASLIELDEVDCPHCGGSGTTGLVGDFCAYCHGDMVVSEEQARNYAPEEMDETDCPHCGGRGLTGITSFICGYCRGSCRVSKMKAGMYDPDEMDEVDCRHCGGRGMTGLSGDICAYCDGAQRITAAAAAEYNRAEIDEVDCPHCHGRGLTGLVGDYCSFCKGSQTVSRKKAQDYAPEKMDEIDCPHCGGSGTTGLVQQYCNYCKGSQTVSRAKAEEYDPEDIDETNCPHCGGSGSTGLRGTICSLCNGTCTVSRDKQHAYRKKFPDRS